MLLCPVIAGQVQTGPQPESVSQSGFDSVRVGKGELLVFDTQASDAADSLSKFYYPPVAAVSISYSKEAICKEWLIDGELKGFGQLHPCSQGLETLGTIYSSSLFPNRAPSGRVLLRNYIGGAINTGIISKESK